MFSAVVHLSMTVTSNCEIIIREKFANDDPSEPEAGRAGKGLAGGLWGKTWGDEHHKTVAQ
jgi:hypothetical protein